MAKKVIVGGRIESKEVGGIVTGAAEILDDSKGKKQSVINQETDAELERLDGAKQDVLTFDNTPTAGSDNPVTSGGLYLAQLAIIQAIAAINELIPSAASALNQLADKVFVNSSISTNTATFRGTSASGLTEQQFLAWANGLTHDLNDYVFWQTVDAAGNTLFKRYKWNGTEWAYEYTLNNSTFTAEQWEAIQSGITALLVTKLRALPTAQELIQSFDGKQDVLTFDNVPTLGSNNPVKSSGIYNVIKAITDLIPAEATAQNQLADKADVAAKILAAIPSWKGQYDALADLQAVTGAKAGDMGCVKTTDSDGHAVLTFYQHSAQGTWVEYYVLRHYAQSKPATTGTTGDYPYNGMGRIELQKNIVNGVNTLTQAMLTQQNTIYVIQYDFTLTSFITIPLGCTLRFEGGSIASPADDIKFITGQDTYIEGGSYKIFYRVGLRGTFVNEFSNIIWWGAITYDIDNTFDNSEAFNFALQYSPIYRVVVPGTFGISSPIIFGTKILEGTSARDSIGDGLAAIIANTDFHAGTLIGDSTEYTIDALIGHGRYYNPVLKNLCLKCNYKAKYGIQMSDQPNNYSNLSIENVYIYDAINAGILQYGCENMKWSQVLVQGCRTGIFISPRKFDPSNPLSAAGVGIGANDMIVLDRVRVVNGNYGIILQSGSNTSLDHCETSRNSIVGLAMIGGFFNVRDFYSERDADGNFYIYEDGTKTYADANGQETTDPGNEGYGRVHPYLIEHNIDGFSNGLSAMWSTAPHIRGLMYIKDTEVHISDLFYTYCPRSYSHNNVTVAQRVEPTERNAAGIDCYIVADENNIVKIDEAFLRPHPNSNVDYAAPFAGVINIGKSNGMTYKDNVQIKTPTIIKYFTLANFSDSSLEAAKIEDRYDGSQVASTFLKAIAPIVSHIGRYYPFEEYNAELEKINYHSNNQFIPITRNRLAEMFRGFPLYEYNTPSGIVYRLTKNEIITKFGDKEVVKYKILIHVTEAINAYITFNTTHYSEDFSVNEPGYGFSQAGAKNLEVGYYEMTGIMRTKPSLAMRNSDWGWTQMVINLDAQFVDKVVVSPICFYEVEDPLMLPPSGAYYIEPAGSVRPYKPFEGQTFFDTSINKQITYNGTAWVDATGTPV